MEIDRDCYLCRRRKPRFYVVVELPDLASYLLSRMVGLIATAWWGRLPCSVMYYYLTLCTINKQKNLGYCCCGHVDDTLETIQT
jgi:hypothetical protein